MAIRQFIDGSAPVPPEHRHRYRVYAGLPHRDEACGAASGLANDGRTLVKLSGSRYGPEMGAGGYAFPNQTPTLQEQPAPSPSIHPACVASRAPTLAYT